VSYLRDDHAKLEVVHREKEEENARLREREEAEVGVLCVCVGVWLCGWVCGCEDEFHYTKQVSKYLQAHGGLLLLLPYAV